MTTKQKITDRYDQGNLVAACLIASDPVKYPLGSLMAQWSDMITSRAVGTEEAKAMALAEAAA